MPELVTNTNGILLAVLIGYLLGSIPWGLVVARAMNLGDLRSIGSGNIGATNVLRTGNRRAAALTLLLDIGKGAAAVLIARALWAGDAAQVAALAAFLGHCYPLWLKFRGGKGVATFIGIMLALSWKVGLAVIGTWLLFAFTLRWSSLAALAAAASSTMWMFMFGRGETFFLGVGLTVLIYWRHRENIRRLEAGTEPKIGQGERRPDGKPDADKE